MARLAITSCIFWSSFFLWVVIGQHTAAVFICIHRNRKLIGNGVPRYNRNVSHWRLARPTRELSEIQISRRSWRKVKDVGTACTKIKVPDILQELKRVWSRRVAAHSPQIAQDKTPVVQGCCWLAFSQGVWGIQPGHPAAQGRGYLLGRTCTDSWPLTEDSQCINTTSTAANATQPAGPGRTTWLKPGSNLVQRGKWA